MFYKHAGARNGKLRGNFLTEPDRTENNVKINIGV